ncbi:nitroreductase [Melioribacter roseus P3M-2]|uniref:Nitroreductase n=1 Tax=Melioribacter roseus (strain DSM 23840 / JCM 17771 / VKM B-2668 / P3M-2) TaxID=1191523 RepID=I7A498_MELRP|nr:nitroreductase family protein [Melioribacter roseus]AFN74736.1 nitroreductase [Melioribacter roseus P3M-2]
MNTIEAILTRRSIRRYKNQPVEKEKIDKILKAAMYAPSSHNSQPWHFVVIDDRETMNKIAEAHPYAQMCREAPIGILICGDREIESLDGYIALNCAAATENILLAAHELELGSVWIAVYPREERIRIFRELFGLPENILPVAMVAIGYPDEKKNQPERFKPERIHYNGW